MASFLSWLSAHGAAVAIASFSLISIVLNAVAAGLQVLGKQAPGWLGVCITWVGTILHWLNGTVVKPTGPVAGPGPTGT